MFTSTSWHTATNHYMQKTSISHTMHPMFGKLLILLTVNLWLYRWQRYDTWWMNSSKYYIHHMHSTLKVIFSLQMDEVDVHSSHPSFNVQLTSPELIYSSYTSILEWTPCIPLPQRWEGYIPYLSFLPQGPLLMRLPQRLGSHLLGNYRAFEK